MNGQGNIVPSWIPLNVVFCCTICRCSSNSSSGIDDYYEGSKLINVLEPWHLRKAVAFFGDFLIRLYIHENGPGFVWHSFLAHLSFVMSSNHDSGLRSLSFRVSGQLFCRTLLKLV